MDAGGYLNFQPNSRACAHGTPLLLVHAATKAKCFAAVQVSGRLACGVIRGPQEQVSPTQGQREDGKGNAKGMERIEQDGVKLGGLGMRGTGSAMPVHTKSRGPFQAGSACPINMDLR